jgi:hypothetical protein
MIGHSKVMIVNPEPPSRRSRYVAQAEAMIDRMRFFILPSTFSLSSILLVVPRFNGYKPSTSLFKHSQSADIQY